MEQPVKKESLDLSTSRLEAFSDGVLAVIITIMVLEIRPPEGASFHDLTAIAPKIVVYLFSFIFIAIYWNNHHHLLRATEKNSPAVMWANLHLLFWLSLMPFTTAWVGGHIRDSWPAAIYGALGAMAGISFYLLITAIVKANKETWIVDVFRTDYKGKASVAIYILGSVLAFTNPTISYVLYAIVSLMWFIPDSRLE